MTPSEGVRNAPMNVAHVMDEIQQNVQRRRQTGELPEDRERELDRLFLAHSPGADHGALTEALQQVDRATFVDPLVPIDSNRKAGALIKRGMRSASLWYVSWLTHQINQFAVATSRSLHIIERRLSDFERIADAELVPSAVVEFPALHQPDAWWVDAAIGAVTGVPGRALHVAAGADDWLVGRIVSAGGDAYGVDPRFDRGAELVHHLRTLVPGALGAVVLSGVTEGMTSIERSLLLQLVTSRLAADGVLVVHSVTPSTWSSASAPWQADLAPGRPLRGETWRHLLKDGGYQAAVQSSADGSDYLVIAHRQAG